MPVFFGHPLHVKPRKAAGWTESSINPDQTTHGTVVYSASNVASAFGVSASHIPPENAGSGIVAVE
jgi:hypothetical protein